MSVETASGLERVSLSPDGELVTDRDDRDSTRIYYDLDSGWMGLSVSEVKSHREDAEKDDAIEGWKQHFDGSTKHKSPHHSEQSAFKMARGTLGHYVILSKLDDTLKKTHEEEHAEELLKNWSDRRPTVVDDSLPDPHGDPHAYDGEQAWSRCMRDINWAMDRFEELSERYNITPESAIEVEQYIRHDEPPYGGQYDLLYEDNEGRRVLADIKLSSGIRHDHKLQLAAYAAACEYEVDRLAVMWLSPEKDEAQLSFDSEWDESWPVLDAEFTLLADEARKETLSDYSIEDIKNAVLETQPAD